MNPWLKSIGLFLTGATLVAAFVAGITYCPILVLGVFVGMCVGFIRYSIYEGE